MIWKRIFKAERRGSSKAVYENMCDWSVVSIKTVRLDKPSDLTRGGTDCVGKK